jgi:hypothetical protein
MKNLVVLTHGGLCHADEILASAIIIYKEKDNYKKISVARTGSNIPEKFKGPENDIWLIDCGMVYDPKSHRFDHHDVRYNYDCSFSQVLKYYGLHEKFLDLFPWYERVIICDNFGTAYWFKMQGENIATSTAQALNNPFESFIRNMFGNCHFIESTEDGSNNMVYTMLFNLGKFLIDSYNNRMQEIELLDSHFNVHGSVGYINSPKMITSLVYHAKTKNCKIIITNSNNGRAENKGCISIISTNSNKYNLSKLNLTCIGQVKFIHSQGYMAVIDPKTVITDDLLEGVAKILDRQLCDYLLN